jgi:imidazole glycerol-phosphate synthase subunit HisH
MVTIVDYGMGNLGSIFNMFKKIGVTSKITSDKKEIEQAEKILLPGVGAFDAAMSKIHELEFKSILDYKALEQKIPVMGICLGMQLLTESSDEGQIPGLGWIPSQTLKFNFEHAQNLKVPHMGWNLVEKNNDSPLIENFEIEARFYFVHSYYVQCRQNEHAIMKTNFGLKFDSIIQKDNIFGAQFHPEKSHKFGMQLFKNFSKI